MKLTRETKAEKKWCPYTRYPLEINVDTGLSLSVIVSVNRKEDNSSPNWAQCISKECIAWERVEFDADANEWMGYCNLMGLSTTTTKHKR